ncbi:unnamed protein product [Lepeophtheirus salmonis]|uniref:(salmon louse) hypothetical protein n=1 Tax=Lepeophtheirus salmonis TaxID=72036 RepID=A0A7R8D846_LEPSM|nr:unnamed protein product [Lepeophtheirus salmonis]CAF3033673.1 unnamed protein product [Lepeophtheirus salmonis]
MISPSDHSVNTHVEAQVHKACSHQVAFVSQETQTQLSEPAVDSTPSCQPASNEDKSRFEPHDLRYKIGSLRSNQPVPSVKINTDVDKIQVSQTHINVDTFEVYGSDDEITNFGYQHPNNNINLVNNRVPIIDLTLDCQEEIITDATESNEPNMQENPHEYSEGELNDRTPSKWNG